jgi:hypothetical protein
MVKLGCELGDEVGLPSERLKADPNGQAKLWATRRRRTAVQALRADPYRRAGSRAG